MGLALKQKWSPEQFCLESMQRVAMEMCGASRVNHDGEVVAKTAGVDDKGQRQRG